MPPQTGAPSWGLKSEILFFVFAAVLLFVHPIIRAFSFAAERQEGFSRVSSDGDTAHWWPTPLPFGTPSLREPPTGLATGGPMVCLEMERSRHGPFCCLSGNCDSEGDLDATAPVPCHGVATRTNNSIFTRIMTQRTKAGNH